MAGAKPRIIGDEGLAWAHGAQGKTAQDVAHGGGHGVDMSGRAGDRLSQHSALGVEDAGGEIARLPHRGAKGDAHQRLGLFLHHGDEAVPGDLAADDGIEGGHEGSLSSPGTWRESHKAPSLNTSRSKPDGTTVVV